MTLMTASDHPPLFIDETRTVEPATELQTTSDPYPRRIYWTVNLILIVLAMIFTVLGIGALRTLKAEREERERVEFCEEFEAQSDLYLETCN